MKNIILITFILFTPLFAENCKKPIPPSYTNKLQIAKYIVLSNKYEQCKTRNLIEKQIKVTQKTNVILTKMLNR